jgi:Salmonella surface presentation of antigen gene type M protein
MPLLHKIGLMIRHCEQAQLRVAEQLARQTGRWRTLQKTIDGLALQCVEIDRLLQSQKLNGCVIDRPALFALQQRQAVLRQQRYQLDFERDRLREETELLEQEQQKTRAEMQVLMRKKNKFAHWSGVQKREHVLRRLLREDMEIEDRVVLVKD